MIVNIHKEGMACPFVFDETGERGPCLGPMCMAWRTVNDDKFQGFCGRIEILPRTIREKEFRTVNRSSGGSVTQVSGSNNRIF